jgi:hypothetical protein
VRRAARAYLQALFWWAPIERWQASIKDRDKAMWFALAMADLLVRTEGVTSTDAIECLKREWTPKFRETGPPDLVLLAALELAHLTGDTGPVETLMEGKPAVVATPGLLSEVARIIRRSEPLRALLRKRGLAALLGTLPKELDETAFGLQAGPPRLVFTVE